MKKLTALDRVGIRRLMIYIDKTIRHTFREKKLKCNTQQELIDLLESCTVGVLNDVKSRKGLFEFSYEIDNLKLEAFICPLKGLEPIVFTLELSVID